MDTKTTDTPIEVTPPKADAPAKERAAYWARQLANEARGALSHLALALADEMDRQLAFDASRAAGNASRGAGGSATNPPSFSGSTSGAGAAAGGVVGDDLKAGK